MTKEPPAAPDDEEDAWPLRPDEGERRGIAGALKLFATGAAGGALALFGLAVLAVPQRCCGATRSVGIDRERQRRCLELGITPEELAERERAAEAVRRAMSAEGAQGAQANGARAAGAP